MSLQQQISNEEFHLHMITIKGNGNTYHIPGGLNDLQQKMYIHLIDWKWKHLTIEPGDYRGNPIDASLPDHVKEQLLLLHPSIAYAFVARRENFPSTKHILIVTTQLIKNGRVVTL